MKSALFGQQTRCQVQSILASGDFAHRLGFTQSFEQRSDQRSLRNVQSIDQVMAIDQAASVNLLIRRFVSRFEDGSIVEEWEVLDQLALLTQLGVVSLPA